MRTIITGFAVLLVVWIGAAEAASPSNARNTQKSRYQGSPDAVIVKLEKKGTFIVDWGTRKKAYQGMNVWIYRRVELKHPITGKKLQDRFLIGEARLLQVSRFLSIGMPKGPFTYPASVGDFVVRQRGTQTLTPVIPAGKPSGQVTQKTVIKYKYKQDPERIALERTWLSLQGKTVAQRIKAWLAFLQVHNTSRYLGQVQANVRWLMGLEKRLLNPQPQTTMLVRHEAPARVALRERVHIVAAVVAPSRLQAVVCYYRDGNRDTYKYIAMREHHRYYYRAVLPPQTTSREGRIDYFIEAIDADGNRIKAHASGNEPSSFRVFTPHNTKGVKKDRSLAHVYSEYVDFFTRAFGRDNYFKLEVDYRFLMQMGMLYSVRMGFGIFEGRGQITETLDQDPNAITVQKAFTYGYLEGELRFHPLFAMMARVALGAIRKNGLQETGGTPLLFGLQGRVRIGKESSTNLVLGFNGTLDVGTEGLIRLTIAVFEKWPMAASVVVTNLPLGRDLGVRFIYQLGWRPVRWISLDALIGWNIRNINHSGPSFGLGVTFRW